MLAARPFDVIEGVERLTAQVVELGIGAMRVEIMGLLEHVGRVLELPSGLCRACRVSRRRCVARKEREHLFELLPRAIEVAGRQCLGRLAAELFGARSGGLLGAACRWRSEYRPHDSTHHSHDSKLVPRHRRFLSPSIWFPRAPVH